MPIAKRVSCGAELEAIRALQEANLKGNLSPEEREREGFVTAVYSADFLQLMHDAEPSVIAVDEATGALVGYALAATREVAGKHDLLADLVRHVDELSHDSQLLANTDYCIVGQLCTRKGFRNRGVAQAMYQHYAEELRGKYRYLVTDIDEKNPMSLGLHLKAGFQVIGTLSFDGASFNVVLWDWNRNNK